LLVYLFLYKKNFLFIKILESTSYFVFATSYLITALINPGIPDKSHFYKNYKFTSKEEVKQYQICKKCNIIFLKSDKVYHCSSCNVCVRNHDHHCPWTGKCIGKYNLKTFYVFVSFLFVFIFSTFITVVMYGVAVDLANPKK